MPKVISLLAIAVVLSGCVAAQTRRVEEALFLRIRQFLNPSDTAWFADMRSVATVNGVTETMMRAIGDGMAASGTALGFADLPSTEVRFMVPYYVVQGREDLFAPTPLVQAYFNRVSAPKKRLFIIDGAGHFALATHQAEVIDALTQISR